MIKVLHFFFSRVWQVQCLHNMLSNVSIDSYLCCHLLCEYMQECIGHVLLDVSMGFMQDLNRFLSLLVQWIFIVEGSTLQQRTGLLGKREGCALLARSSTSDRNLSATSGFVEQHSYA